MKNIEATFDNIKESFDGILLLGNFDGVHKGHVELVRTALDMSDNVAVLLFKNHPLDVFKPEEKHPFLTTLDDKIRRFRNLGVDTFYVIDNTIEFYNHSKDEFIEFLKRINPSKIVVGEDYTFGKGKEGNVSHLKECFSTSIVPLLKINDTKVGTYQIKELLKNGDVSFANNLLGYNYEVRGKVIKGYGNGRTIGFPTANLELKDNYLLPKNGVYKTLVYVRGIPHYAITNVGKNPTVGLLKHQIVESYIKDINEDLYGESIYVSFIEYLRDEKKFDSLDDLKAQLEQDKKTI